jgi:cyclophilin family peptidyl-prolyl cis-trans isomerase
MHFIRILLILILFLLSKELISQDFYPETVLISTDFGDIKLKLYKQTPLHSENFIKLVKNGFYDSLLFHRVIKGFMIQAGDPDSKKADQFKLLGDGDLAYTIPAEFKPNLFHKKGVLCAARNSDDVNPTKASSACQFYIVQGKVRTEEELVKYEKRINQAIISRIKDSLLKSDNFKAITLKLEYFKTNRNNDSLMFYYNFVDKKVQEVYDKTFHYTFPEEHKIIYKTIGGAPHLDTQYTVFGEVTEGLDVIDKIAEVNTNADDRPLRDVRIKKVLIN